LLFLGGRRFRFSASLSDHFLWFCLLQRAIRLGEEKQETICVQVLKSKKTNHEEHKKRTPKKKDKLNAATNTSPKSSSPSVPLKKKKSKVQ